MKRLPLEKGLPLEKRLLLGKGLPLTLLYEVLQAPYKDDLLHQPDQLTIINKIFFYTNLTLRVG